MVSRLILACLAASLTAAAQAPAPPKPVTAAVALTASTPTAQVAPGERIARAPDGLFYAVATINGARVRFLVDTGANIVLLTAEAARRAGIRPGRTGTMMQTASGGAPLSLTTVGHMRLGGQDLRDVPAGVVGSGGLPVSLLGQSALARMRGIRIEGDTLHLL